MPEPSHKAVDEWLWTSKYIVGNHRFPVVLESSKLFGKVFHGCSMEHRYLHTSQNRNEQVGLYNERNIFKI